MEKRPHALLLKFPGTNCDVETARALESAGFSTKVVPIARANEDVLSGVDLVVLSGGFSYGDYVMAGRLAQLETERRLGDALKKFHADGGYLLGICNGFQILTKLGILPGGSLIDNTSGRFQCRWATLKNHRPDSAFLKHLPEEFELPVAHAEGRFVTAGDEALSYINDGLAALTYTEDINGSTAAIAGLLDETGRALGLMPHPERFLEARHHYDPDWKAQDGKGSGYWMFKSLYEAIAA